MEVNRLLLHQATQNSPTISVSFQMDRHWFPQLSDERGPKMLAPYEEISQKGQYK